MRILAQSALFISFAAALLAGCGGPPLPIKAPGVMPQSRAIAEHGRSWMLPEAKSEDLLYASDNTGNKVYVFSYPKAKLVGTLTGFDSPVGACVDQAGDVWIVNQLPAEVIEYAHGGSTPIRTLTTGSWPYGCAIDQGTGNLAVIDWDNEILIFQNAQNPGILYMASDFYQLQYGGYDNNGNFFSVGYSYSLRAYALSELPKDGSEVNSISISPNVKGANVVQWDGKDLAVGGYAGPRWPAVPIYRVTVSGSHAQIIGTTRLRSRGHVWQQFWIQNHTIIQASDDLVDLSFWRYPKGGAATKTITKVGQIWGVVVSSAPPHK